MSSKKKDLVLNIRMRGKFGLHTCTNESFHIFFVESGERERKPKNQHSECIRKSEDDKRKP